MRKVTKILAKLLSATILLLIILPLTISLLLTLPSMQNFAMRQATAIASKAIGSRVVVGRVDFSMLSEVVLRDVLIEDMGGDTMIFAKTAKAKISALSTLKKELRISSVTVEDGEFRLSEIRPNIMNITEIIEKITKPGGNGAFKTKIDRIYAKNIDFKLQRLVKAKVDYGVNFTDMELYGINAKLSDFVSIGPLLTLSIDQMEATERSGIHVDSFVGDLTIYEGVVDLVEMKASTDSSYLDIPKLRLESDLWEHYADFNSNVSLDITSDKSRLALSDVAYFAPALQGKSFEARNLSLLVNGTVNNMEVQISEMEFGDNGKLKADLSLQEIETPLDASYDANIKELQIDGNDLNYTMVGFGLPPLNNDTQAMIDRLGITNFLATAKGDIDKTALSIALRSPLGSAKYDGTLRDLSSQIKVDGDVSTEQFLVGKLINNKLLGALDMHSAVRYHILEEGVDANLDGSVTSLGYNSCSYSDINFDASFDGTTLDTEMESKDSKLDFNLLSQIELGTRQHYDITMRVNNADLVALALNHRDSLSQISGSIKINAGFSNLDDIDGQVTLRNIDYRYDDRTIYAPMIAVNARNKDNNKLITLDSDYIDIALSSKSSLEGLYDYIATALRDYIPVLYAETKESNERKNKRKVTIADDYSTLQIDFKNIAEISDAIIRGFDIADNSSFRIMANPYSERFSARFDSDYIEYGTVASTGLNITASNDKDSLALYAIASDLFVGRTSFADFNLMAGARNNVVELSTGFRDSIAMRSATLGLRTQFVGAQKAIITLLPSQLSLSENMWMISSGEILGEAGSLTINDFSMESGNQRMGLDGVISKNDNETLTLELDNYDIGLITSVVNDLGYVVDGRSNGYMHISQLLSNPRVVADINLDSVAVNSIPAPALKLRADWNATENAAQLFVTNRQSRDTVMVGDYIPSEVRYAAHLKVDSLDMRLLDPLLSTTITDTHGYANVDATLTGQGNDASLQGGIDVYDLRSRVIFTQVEYNIPSAHIDIEDNVLSCKAQPLFDRDGNGGFLTLNVSLDRLSNVAYMLRIVPENMLVLNTTEQDNELFYGTLYASGVATISGDMRGVDMNITATSQANSSFFMPLSTQSTVAKTDFITFVERNPDDALDAGEIDFRKLFLEQREQRLNEAEAQRVNVDLSLHVTPDLDFQLVIDPVVGDVIKAKGEGRFNMKIAPQENIFEMYGDYDITEGNYLFALLNPISKRFTIDSGSSIQWMGNPLDPQLNINAVYKVKTSLDPLINSTSDYSSESSSRALPVDCIIHLGDKLSQPSVNFSIEVPTADTEQQAVIANTLIDQETISQQFFYLLIANSFVPVASTNNNVLNSTTTASTGFELLTNQLSNWLSSSNYDFVIRYRPGSDVDLTSDEVDLGFSRGLIDNRLLIELEGNYLADNKAALNDSDISNFMGEAYITWLIDKAGTLRLKGFTQTIDRYDENQGLQETGIGIYFSESFDNFKDLKRKIVDRFRRKKKK